LVIREELVHRAEALQQAQAQTDVLAGSVSAALAFEDEAAMRQDLSALMRNPQVAAAGIYGPDGRRLALLPRPGADPAPGRLAAAGVQHVDGRDEVAQAVTEQGERLGFVYLQTTPEDLSEFIGRHTGLVILTLLALLLLTFMTRAAARLARANVRLNVEIAARA